MNIAPILEALLNYKHPLDRECKLHVVLSIMALSHHYLQQCLQVMSEPGKRERVIQLIRESVSVSEN